MKKLLILGLTALGVLAALAHGADAATFDGTSVVTALDAEVATDTIVSGVTMFVTTVVALSVFLITKMFGMRIIGFVANVFRR